MGDILIRGKAPRSDHGKEYFLHSTDWWIDILEVIRQFASDTVDVRTWACSGLIALPFSPDMTEEEAEQLSYKLEQAKQEGALRPFVEKIAKNNLSLIGEEVEDPEQWINNETDFIMGNIENFIRFLKDCGGCISDIP